MVGNIIAYTIVAAFALPGFGGIWASVSALRKKQFEDCVKLFYPSVLLLSVALFFAWMWGI